MKVIFSSVLPETLRGHYFSDGAQCSPACLSHSSSITVRTSKGQCWNCTDRENQAYWGKNLSRCHTIQQRPQKDSPGFEPGGWC